MEPTIFPSPIEGQLFKDRDGALRKRLRKRLQRALRQLEAELGKPQTTETYARLVVLRDACAAGKATLDKAWRRLQDGRSH